MQEILFDPQTSGGRCGQPRGAKMHPPPWPIEQLSLPCAIVGTIIATRDKPIVVY